MAELRVRFVKRAREEVDGIEAQLAAREWMALRGTSHGLSGRAGMFGFPEVGEAAQALEEAIDTGAPQEEIVALGVTLLALMRELPQGR